MNDTPTERPRTAPVAEARHFLEQNPDIEAAQIVITDCNGVGRGKNIARSEIESLYVNGRNVAGSILGLDVTGEDAPETGLVWDVGDADQVCRPVPGALVRAPWLSRPTAQVLLSMFALDGTPAVADPRHVLARQVERLAERGLHPVVAVEYEFFLLQRGESGRLMPAAGLRSGQRRERIDAYELGRLDEMAPLFDDVFAAARLQGLPLRTLMTEYAPGQFEITLEHRPDALRAVDDAIMFKRAVKGVAARHGCVACFMAKPFENSAGTGMHIHVSLADEQGRNVFAAEDPTGTELLRHAIGGLRETMAESMLIFAPHANSFRRFRKLSYAPVTTRWGVNNRTVSLRIPAGPAASRHLEHRVPGADANPYLAASVVLAGMLRGIEQRIDPGPPMTGNAYDKATCDLPTRWHEALARASDSQFLQQALGPGMHKVLLAVKRQEFEKFTALVSNRDYEWYLDTV